MLTGHMYRSPDCLYPGILSEYVFAVLDQANITIRLTTEVGCYKIDQRHDDSRSLDMAGLGLPTYWIAIHLFI